MSFLSITVTFYLALAGAAAASALLLGPLPPLVARPAVAGAVRDVALGLGLAAAVVGVSLVCRRMFEWGKRLERELASILGPLEGMEIVTLALFSGVAEELFFRGAVQTHLGLVSASLLFGIFHLGPSAAFVPWTVFALAVGFLFGGVVVATGSLLPVIVAHVGVNLVNLRRIVAGGAGSKRD